MKTLFIEDDRIWRDTISEILQRKGYDISKCAVLPDSIEGLEKFELVICDNKISGVRVGFDFLVSLRRSGFKGTLVLYTSFPSREVFEIGLRYDINLISKRGKLSEKLDEILAQQSATRN